MTTTVNDARAILALNDYIEGRFQIGMEYDPEHTNWTVAKGATNVFGEPYIELTSHGWYPTREAVIEAAKSRFDDYAKDKNGKLYWRVRPEIEKDARGWRFYMRLVISDREAK